MSGRPITNERNRAFREALLRGEDPSEALKPFAERLRQIALEGESGNATTLGAIKEVVDRVEGKVKQEIEVQKTSLDLDANLLNQMKDLLKLAKKEEKVVREVEPERLK